MKTSVIADIAKLLDAAQKAENDGRWIDALGMYETIIEADNLSVELRPQVLRRIGSLYFYRGDFDRAGKIFGESCDAAREAGLLAQLASGMNCLANVKQSVGQLDDAERLFKEALGLAEQSGHGRLAVMIDQNLGTIASIRGDNDTAYQRYSAALTRYEQANDVQGAAWVLNNLGMVHTESSRWNEAHECFYRALLLSDQRGDIEMVATVHLNLASMHHRARDYEKARTSADRAFAIFTRLDSKQGLGEVAKLYGMLYRDSGKTALAEAYLHVVVNIARANDFMLLQAEAESEYALVHQAAGKSREALISLNNSHRIFGQLRAQHRLANIELQLDKLEQKYLLVTKVWGDTIESKDKYTAGHCGRVAEYACKLAQAAGLGGRDLAWIRMAGYLHDVGKTAINAAILTKPSQLDAREWAAIKQHPVIGHKIVSEMNFPWDIATVVRNHHENWDGSGYPDNLAGDAIPLIARIMRVADVYDALTSTRSYRAAYSPEDAIRLMGHEAGRTVDPNLFAMFEAAVWPKL